jgi:dihydrolipoamide dehydrogenase
MDFDVAVIGGGPGGYVAAIRAAQLGAKVALIEKSKLGGVCLNRGCIPTKTLLKSAEKWHDLQHCDEFGLQASNIGFDYHRIRTRMNQVIQQLQSGILQLVKSNDIALLTGTAALQGSKRIQISATSEATVISASKTILAAGSTPMELSMPGGDLTEVINSDQLLALADVPKSLIVVGAGAVGIEFASIYRSFGCEVTVVEMMPSILPGVDIDIVKRMGLILRRQGIKMMTGSKVKNIQRAKAGIIVEVEDSNSTQTVAAEKLLAAIGRRPALAGLGLDEAGIEYSRQGIRVDDKMRTNVDGIYAIGDITGQYMLAHAASAEGVVAAENALGNGMSMDYRAVPSCIFTSPEIAMVGLTEHEAQKSGLGFKASRFNFAANGKAVSMGESDGLVKIIADSLTGQIIGMHILGPHASDLIMEGALAIRNKLSAADVARTIHPHPGLSETVMECAHGIDGHIIHQVKAGNKR